ncbi:hypothetical protein C8J57DRAFT_1247753 [Mycena rebaudengoi]|nr:hypothetical protein C8J57DRAFT_1247753 [Mycena rebaudengoi]
MMSPGNRKHAELNEVEVHARSLAALGDCARRYKNMNGLRYHYQHSGDHGAVGMGLVGGVHRCLRTINAKPAPAKAAATTIITPAPTSAPSQTRQTRQTPKTEATPFTPPTAPASAVVQYHDCGSNPAAATPPAAAAANSDYLAQMLHCTQYAQYQMPIYFFLA